MSSNVMKYYLSQESDFSKKVLNLIKEKGYKHEILNILLDSKLSQEQIIKAISHVINSLKTEETNNSVTVYIDSILPLLPKSIRTKTKLLSPFLDRIMTVEKSGKIMYYSGESSGNLIDYVKFLTSPYGTFSSKEPPNIELLMNKLELLSPPKAAFGHGKHPDDYTSKDSKWVIT